MKIRIALLLVLFCAAARADVSGLYDKGDYAEARAAYEAMVKSGPWSANLFYNLGNAAFRQGDKAAAFLAYERALALEPGHAEAAANLNLLREETGAKLPERTWLDRALSYPAGDTAAWLAAGAFWSVCFLLFRKQRLLALGCALVLAWCGAALWRQNSRGALWIVTSPAATARSAPADNAAATAKLPMGSHVRLLSERGPWLHTASGWMARDEAEPVRLAR